MGDRRRGSRRCLGKDGRCQGGQRLKGSAGQARDRRCRAVTWHDLGEKHLATNTPDEIGPDNLIEAVVVALDEQLWLDLPNELDRLVLLEDDDQIDGGEGGQHGRALGFVLNRTSRSFEPDRKSTRLNSSH